MIRHHASWAAALGQEQASTLQFVGSLKGPGVRTSKHSECWNSRQGLFGKQYRGAFKQFNDRCSCVRKTTGKQFSGTHFNYLEAGLHSELTKSAKSLLQVTHRLVHSRGRSKTFSSQFMTLPKFQEFSYLYKLVRRIFSYR